MATFVLSDWSIVPGPEESKLPGNSLTGFDITAYPPETVAAALLAISGVQLVSPNTPDWWSWRARWAFDGAHIDLAMTLIDDPEGGPATWGGFGLSGSASASRLLYIYERLHAALPCAWLHNSDCEFHTAARFAKTTGARRPRAPR